MTTHAELVAAVEKRRYPGSSIQPDFLVRDRDALVVVLAALLKLHTPSETDDRMCAECPLQSWPCDSVGIVVDALRKMGVPR